MKTATAIAAALVSTVISSSVAAQSADTLGSPKTPSRWELVIPSGTMVPTGAQRDAIKRGSLNALQLAYAARRTFAVTSTVGWARTRDLANIDNPKVDVFTYDIGAEVRAPGWIEGKGMTVSPFAGLGAGGRSYNYRSLDVDATHNLAAYGSVGSEIGVRRIRLRLEARDYVAGFKPLSGQGAARTANDVVVMVGLRLVSR